MSDFETAAVARLNSGGRATDDGSDESAVNVLLYGTEQGTVHDVHGLACCPA